MKVFVTYARRSANSTSLSGHNNKVIDLGSVNIFDDGGLESVLLAIAAIERWSSDEPVILFFKENNS